MSKKKKKGETSNAREHTHENKLLKSVKFLAYIST